MLQEKLKKIEIDVKDYPIVLFMKGNKNLPMCGFSARVVAILQRCGAEFEARDVLQDEDLRAAIKEFSNWPTLPQLYIRGKFIGGCDIVEQMYESGELQDLLTQ